MQHVQEFRQIQCATYVKWFMTQKGEIAAVMLMYLDVHVWLMDLLLELAWAAKKDSEMFVLLLRWDEMIKSQLLNLFLFIHKNAARYTSCFARYMVAKGMHAGRCRCEIWSFFMEFIWIRKSILCTRIFPVWGTALSGWALCMLKSTRPSFYEKLCDICNPEICVTALIHWIQIEPEHTEFDFRQNWKLWQLYANGQSWLRTVSERYRICLSEWMEKLIDLGHFRGCVCRVCASLGMFWVCVQRAAILG